MTTLQLRKSIGRSPLRCGLILISLALAFFALLPRAQAVVPAPDGAYPGYNTAEGQSALLSLTTGIWNTANGAFALYHNTTGLGNTASGFEALFNNTTGFDNTAIGVDALYSNTTGVWNTANGDFALDSNTDGNYNTANGVQALASNTTGGFNTANGAWALYHNTTGFENTAIGEGAGFNITSSGNVCIGEGVLGVVGESNITRIRNIGTTAYNTGRYVQVDAAGKLGYVVSSRRYKHEIKPMEKASEALYALKPVTYRYNGDIDPAHVRMFGLIAEEVNKVAPDLVVRNEKGEPETLRFDSINAMLLNEFLKEHRTVQELESTAAKQEATIAKQQKQIEALTAGLQKVSAEAEMSRPTPQTVAKVVEAR